MEKVNFGVNLDSIGDDDNLIDVNVEAPKAEESKEPPAATTKEEEENKKEPNEDPNLIEIPDVVDNETQSASFQQAPNTDSPSDNTKIATPLAKALAEEGVISEVPENFDGTTESLLKLLKGEIDSGVSKYINGLPQEIKTLVERYQENVPLDQLIETRSRQIAYKNIQEDTLESNVELAKKLVATDLKNRGYSDEKIADRIALFEENDKLTAEAKDALSTLKVAEANYETNLAKQAQEQKKKAEETNRTTLESIQNKLKETEEIVPGIKLNEKVRDQIYESMTKVVKEENGKPMNAVMETRSKNPLQFEMTLHYLHHLGVFDGDFSKLKESEKTNAVKELEQMLNNQNTSTAAASGNAQVKRDPDKQSSILSGLSVFNYEQ